MSKVFTYSEVLSTKKKKKPFDKKKKKKKGVRVV